jgi:outer membrane lipoprotein-sorting protein
VKTRSSFYQYPIKKTPLNLILDKNFLIEKIYKISERLIDGNLVNYTIKEKDYEINIFFDKQNYNLVGWQNVDMYQNFNITFISEIRKNRLIPKNLFKIPTRN